MSGLTTQERAQLRAARTDRKRGGRGMGEDFYVAEPVRRVARRVIRPGLIVSTVIACGSAETVIFTKSSGPNAHKGFEVEVVHGPPDRADAQHRAAVHVVILGEVLARLVASATAPALTAFGEGARP